MSISAEMKYQIVRTLCVFAVILACSVTWAQEPVKKYTETFKDKRGDELTFDMVLIEGGEFVMGSEQGEQGRQANEGPVHKVTVEPFYLCTTETTLKLFLAYYEETNKVKATHDALLKMANIKKVKKDIDAITGPTPVFGELTMGFGKQNPAMGMTWHTTVHFCQWLSKHTGKTYRLPTEAEWEYAARAGGNYPDNPDQYAWYGDNSDGEPHPVAQKKPNGWGLFDMAGNVREWVHDFYSPTAYETPNSTGPLAGEVHVARGGDYDSYPDELRPSARAFEEKWWRDGDPQIPKSIWWLPNMDIIGFRLARSIDDTAASKPVFSINEMGTFDFDTGTLKGKVRQGGKSKGLSSMVHIPTGTKLDSGMGLLSYYRVFTKDKRYGSGAWDWPSQAKLLTDGAIEVTWPKADDRPFELISVYRWNDSTAIDVETTVKATMDLENFEVFLASYFNKSFPSSSVFVAPGSSTGPKPKLFPARKSYGDWLMFVRDDKVSSMIKDGRWKKEPNPVRWTIMHKMQDRIAVRATDKGDLNAVLMAPCEDCYAISTPYEGEGHYSTYLSLFGYDVKAGQTAKAKSRLVITTETSQKAIVALYEKYMNDLGK